MKTPVLSSGLYEGNRLLFDHRTYNGEVVAFPSALDTGLELIGKLGPLRGWVAAQNGVDEAGDSTAFTVRGLWDVFGRPACLQNEGALNAPEDPALTIGGAIYFDTLDDNFSTQYLEAAFTLSRMSLQSEFVDNGSGFGGDLYSFGVTGSFLVLPDVEVAARYESASRDDGPYLWRFAANKYFDGHDVKAQLVYTTADSNTRRVNVDLFSLGLVASF
jgi:hypothetical protein